jgi:NAD(P)-dependent dehydrogenase (short-subunit alcohol dehydrogenase family)
MLLADKVVLVTGCASGIGRAIARESAAEGAYVIGVDRDRELGEAVTGELTRHGGEFHAADVGSVDDIDRVIAGVADRHGRLDIVHSNAAMYALGTATELSEADWDRTIDVCLKATWALAHTAMPLLQESGAGAMVIISSVHAVRGYRRHTAYQAAKGGLVSLTRALAVDYAPDVRVNCIMPGPIVTGLWRDVPEPERARLARRVPLGRNGSPEDVANVAVFLSSDRSGFMTGTSTVVDGGLCMTAQGEWPAS